MENRICPSDELIAEYSSGSIRDTEREMVEKHIASCARCRRLLVEILSVKKAIKPDIGVISLWGKRNIWFLCSFLCIVMSFFMPRYFLQLLAFALITGAKWIIDSRTTRMLVMIYEAWRKKDDSELGRLISGIKRGQFKDS